jgi:hypothetical protein
MGQVREMRLPSCPYLSLAQLQVTGHISFDIYHLPFEDLRFPRPSNDK